MASKKNEKSGRWVAIEICHTQLHCAIATRDESGAVHLQTNSVTWRKEAQSLNTDSGPTELTAALKQLIDEQKLQGSIIHFSLNGDYCVTRIVTGPNEKVEEELNNLEERSNLYLSLGHGKKALGGSIRPIDARSQHALLTVVNQQTLDALVAASREANFKLKLVEPSLVSLARIMGHVGLDDDGPKLIVNLGEKGVEVGISQKGQLLLDYRPPGIAVNGRLATVIVGHLGRLQRYCDRYVGFSKGQLNAAVICGSLESVEQVGEGFRQQTTIPIQLLTPDHSKLPWTFEGDVPGPQYYAVLGVMMIHFNLQTEQKTPNLMERLNALMREPLMPAVIRTMWPVAAALVVAFLLGCVNFYQGMRVSAVTAEFEDAKAEEEKATKVLKDIENAQKKLVYMRNISSRISNPAWDELTAMIGQCLPTDAWLETVAVDRSGAMIITGGSLTQDGVYEFEKWLNTLPALTRVSLGGTETVQTTAGPTITFNVRCEVVEYLATEPEKGKRNDNA